MSEFLGAEILGEIEDLKVRIAKVSEKDISSHPSEFEQIHRLLQQALSNLDGI